MGSTASTLWVECGCDQRSQQQLWCLKGLSRELEAQSLSVRATHRGDLSPQCCFCGITQEGTSGGVWGKEGFLEEVVREAKV